VTLSGDSHNGWFSHLTTLGGARVGVEFAGTSVTSPGFESVGLGGLGSSLDGSVVTGTQGSGLGLINDLAYADSARRGYLLLTVKADTITGDYVYVDTVKSNTYTAAVGKTITVTAGGDISYA
jgi:alkaline phosphatase D